MQPVKLLLISLLSLSSLACVTQPQGPLWQSQQASPQSARLEIYRPADVEATATAPYIEINGKALGQLPPGSYLAKDLPPGTVEVVVREAFMQKATRRLIAISLDLQPKQVQQVRYQRLNAGSSQRRGKSLAITNIELTALSSAEAELEISQTRQPKAVDDEKNTPATAVEENSGTKFPHVR